MPRGDRQKSVRPSDAYDSSYGVAVADDWSDPDPDSVAEALNRAAGGHAGVVLVAATAPTNPADGQAWLDTSATGGSGMGILTVDTFTAEVTLTSSHTVVLCDTTFGGFPVRLPAAASNPGRLYFIKNIGSPPNPLTIDPNAQETIDGALTAVVARQNPTVMIVSDGSNWRIL